MAIERLNDRWEKASLAERKVFEQEGVIIKVTEEIWRVLNDKGWTKAQLAQALGKSKSYVTQLLNGSRNMTLRTLSDICFALETTIRIEVGEPKRLSLCWDDFAARIVGDDLEIEVPQATNSVFFEEDTPDENQAWQFVQKVAA